MKKKPISFWIKIILVVCCVMPLLVICIKNGYHKHVFENMLEGSKYVVEEKLPPLLEEEKVVERVDCSFSASIEKARYLSFFEWNEYCEVIIHVYDEFDQWSDREQYEFIDDLGDSVGWHIQCIMDEEYPYYWEYDEYDGILLDIYGECVFRKPKQDIFFKTSKNTYEYATYVENYFIKNGTEIYVRDENGDWDGGNWGTGLSLPTISKDGKCCFGSCRSSVREGSAYCHVHSCCKDDCPNMKDTFVHCCDEHSCIEPGCGKHRYDYANSKYCNTHYNVHYYD